MRFNPLSSSAPSLSYSELAMCVRVDRCAWPGTLGLTAGAGWHNPKRGT